MVVGKATLGTGKFKHALHSGMKSGGFDRHSCSSSLLIEALRRGRSAAAHVQLQRQERITLVDYGCSEGRNSMFVLGRAADALRARGADHPLVGVLSDLASNNFNQVFANLSFADQLAAQQTNWPSPRLQEDRSMVRCCRRPRCILASALTRCAGSMCCLPCRCRSSSSIPAPSRIGQMFTFRRRP